MKIAMVGTGYVGLVTAACLAEMGSDVFCYDTNEQKIDQLNQGEIPIYEPGLQEFVVRNKREQRLHFSHDLQHILQECEICFIAVGTPPFEDGSADKRYVFAAAKNIAEHMSGDLLVAVKSTVPVGTCFQVKEMIAETLKQRGVSYHCDVVSNPEFLKEGKAIEDFMRPDRIVIGANNAKSLALISTLYSHFLRNGNPLITMDILSAEMTKYAANVMLATRISLINQIALICERVGADILNVRKGIGSDKRIGMDFLHAGIGYGGSCFPKDVEALSRMAIEANCPADILDAVDKVNRYQKMLLANKVYEHFKHDVKGRTFAMWGLAFKPGTDDIREAPSLTLIRRLTDLGAKVVAYDPQAVSNTQKVFAENSLVQFTDSMYSALTDADALLLVTEWTQFRSPNFAAMKKLLKNPLIFDGRNQYDPLQMKNLGFEYHGLGRGSV